MGMTIPSPGHGRGPTVAPDAQTCARKIWKAFRWRGLAASPQSDGKLWGRWGRHFASGFAAFLGKAGQAGGPLGCWRIRKDLILTLGSFLILTGCGRNPEPAGPVYADQPDGQEPVGFHFAVHPLHNPQRLVELYGPLADYLNANLDGVRFSIEASRDYAEFERKYRVREDEFILPNPWQCLEAMKAGYEVIAMTGLPEDFKGLILVRQDSPIRQVQDLKGKAVSYPSPTALAACMMPQWFLHANGLDINRDVINRFVGSQESSILNVFLEQTQAGCTWPPPWRAFRRDHPEQAAQLKVLWETPPLVNNAVMVRSGVPAVVREAVRRLLLQLHEIPAGRAILARMETDRFLPATAADYEPVRRFIATFEAEVRPVEARR